MYWSLRLGADGRTRLVPTLTGARWVVAIAEADDKKPVTATLTTEMIDAAMRQAR